MPEIVFGTAVESLSKGIDLLKETGVLEKVKNKLVSNPDAAASKLALVLSALGGTYQIVDDTLVQFAAMSFEDHAARRDALELLNKARGGRLKAAMMEARAHCHKIWYIYERYLKGWFSKVLHKQEQEDIEDLFIKLSRSDESWVDMLANIATNLQRASDEMISALEYDDVARAVALQLSLKQGFRTQQSRLSEGLVEFQKLKQGFTALTGGIEL
jgi:hypothetical protein